MKNVILKTDNLCKSYILGKNAVNVLKNVNLEIYEGDFTVIMGSSGSGKSTLLYSLSSMDQPTSGMVELMGKDMSKMKEKEVAKIRNKELSFIFQGINLLNDLTAFENVAYPLYLSMPKNDANQCVEELLDRIGMLDQKDKYPSEMSGGQQQRIAILRAVASRPKLLFGDEPTGALNSNVGRQVLDLLTQLNEDGQSIVMVTHDMKAGVRGNRLIYLSDGRIVGELNLGKYKKEDQKQREQLVFKFLEDNNW